MTDDLKKNRDDADPLSATAMFLRALDQESGSKQSGPASKPEPVAPGLNEKRDPGPIAGQPAVSAGEFTKIFGTSAPSQSASEPASAARTPETPRLAPGAPGIQGPGEFTRIFVKDAPLSARPVSKNADELQESSPFSPLRPKGFSTPGASDAAQGETGFTQIFKPAARPAPGAGNAGDPIVSPLRPEPLRESTPAGAIDGRGLPGEVDRPKQNPSITSLIESLSASASPAGSQRIAEPAPYRSDSPAFQQAPVPPSKSPQFDAGGVTSFIQRLSDPPEPKAPASSPVVHVPSSEPGEYTQIISAPSRTIETVPAPTPPSPAPSPAPTPAPEIAFARPPVPPAPQVAVQVPIPQAHMPMPAAHPAAVPAMAAPKIPAPQLPAVPAPPAAAAPKGKLEALVPMLLVVNAFLLVAILVVLIFLIKGR